MNAELESNYAYWQQRGRGWFNEYEGRKTFILYFHIQEIFLTEYVSRFAPAKVLDYGCGVGRHLRNLREIPGVAVYGYDQSPTMIADMGNWATDHWVQQHVRLGQPVGRLPFDDKTFDIVFTNEVLVHTRPEDLEAVLCELLRVTSGRILHLEPGPSTSLIGDAHGGCWGHNLAAAYKRLGLKPKLLPPLFASQIPIEVTLDEKVDVRPAFSEPACELFRRMESALRPALDRGGYEETLTRNAAAAPVLDFATLFDSATAVLKVPAETLSRDQLALALSLLAQKLNLRINHLENHVAYLKVLSSSAVKPGADGFNRQNPSSANSDIVLDSLPDPNGAAQGSQVWVRYVKPERHGPMMPWDAIIPTAGWRLVAAEGCMYDQALLGEAPEALTLPGGNDPEISFMGHPRSGRISLKWQEREHDVDLYRPRATEFSVRLLDLPVVTSPISRVGSRTGELVRKILFVYPEAFFFSGGGISTYLMHAVQAHLDAGREVHLLTWTTAIDPSFSQIVRDEDLHPLKRNQVTILRIQEDEIHNINPVGLRAKNISDILYPHIVDLEERFQPDLIETSDYAVPLHSYLERRRCGMHPNRIPVAVFNHGLLNDVWPATGMLTSEATVRELALEIQVVRWSDLVLVPSNRAATRIKQMRRTGEGVHIVREPYVATAWKRQAPFDSSRFIYFGRVSLAKGVDIFAGLLTAASRDWPISDILFIGRRVDVPFRHSDAGEFVRARLGPDIRRKARFMDGVPREEVCRLIADTGFFGNFSRSETFSYTTVEALSNGVVPLVLRDSPMAELLPPDIRERGTFAEVPHRTETICKVLAFWRDNYDKAIAACQQYAAALTTPTLYARRYEDIITITPAKASAPMDVRYSGRDVSVLICTHNDADLLAEAIRSAREQTVGVAEILVLDDGTFDPVQLARLDILVRDNPIRLIRVRNMGLVAGRNVLVEYAQTPLVIFLDADDILDPSYVEKTLRAINSDPDRWSAVLTRRKNFGMNEHEASLFLLDTPMHWVHNDFRMTALIKRSVLQDIRFDPAIRNGEADDWWWWLNFTLRGYEATFVPEPLFRYRSTLGSMSLPWSEGQAAFTIELLKRVAADAVRMNRNPDTSLGFQLALMTAYRNGWDGDSLRSGRVSVAVPFRVNENLATLQLITRSLFRLVGRQHGAAIVRLVQLIVYSHGTVRWCARRILRGIAILTRPAPS